MVGAFLLDPFRNRLAENACVDFAIGEMNRRPDALNIARMNGQIGYSQKHFTEMFRRRVGVTPKAYLKIMRFQHAIKCIAETADIDWAAMAAECGFYDQSHFINDFKHFSGFTPEQYSRIQTEYQNYVPVG